MKKTPLIPKNPDNKYLKQYSKDYENGLMNYKKMIQDIDDIVNNDFSADMECKSCLEGQKEFTQDDAKMMADTISRVYKISHSIHCKTCGIKYE